MTLDNKIISRLQKLLALADKSSGATEAEALVAMQKAQELMADHNVSMAELGAAGEQEGREKSALEKAAAYEYQQRLMAAVAAVNFCNHLVRQTGWNGRRYTKRHHVLISKKSNVIAATLMFQYLNSTIERLAPFENAQRLSRSAISWKEGCASRLVTRLNARKREMEAASEAKAQASQQAAREASAAASHPSAAPSQPGAASGALVVRLANLYVDEADLNNDYRFGYEPGTTAARKARNLAEWEAGRERREAEEAAAEAAKTPQQRAKEEAESKKWQERWERKQQKRWDNKDMNAYWAGHDKGDEIGLDTQIDKEDRKSIS